MSAETYGAAATIASRNRGLYGVRAVVTLPSTFHASGVDSRNYFDAYVGIFTSSAATAFIEAGIGYYGELHRDKTTDIVSAAPFAHHWSTLLNPLGGALRGGQAQGQRNALYTGHSTVSLELTVPEPNRARFLVNGSAFRGASDFSFGFSGRGVQKETWDSGLNIKASIGFNDADDTVRFNNMAVRIDSVYMKDPQGKLYRAQAMGFQLVSGLPGATVEASGTTLTVSYQGVPSVSATRSRRP